MPDYQISLEIDLYKNNPDDFLTRIMNLIKNAETIEDAATVQRLKDLKASFLQKIKEI